MTAIHSPLRLGVVVTGFRLLPDGPSKMTAIERENWRPLRHSCCRHWRSRTLRG